MKIVCIIQARMGSTRLPGKVAMDICGQPMLARVVRLAQTFSGVDEIMVATSTQDSDQAVVDAAECLGVPCVRGSEDDVLARFYDASLACQADAIVRITADCPLLDPKVSSKVIEAFIKERPDYASNMIHRTYPRGLDTEIVSRDILDLAHREATRPADREHVTWFVRRQPDRFRQVHIRNATNLSNLRWTVDTPEDLELMRRIYGALGDRTFGFHDVLRLLGQNPDWKELNRHIEQKEVSLPVPGVRS